MGVLITMLRLAASRAAARWMPSMPQASFCSSTDLLSGTVKWYDSSKGYGFITQDKDGSDLFCHQTTIEIDGFRQLMRATSSSIQSKKQTVVLRQRPSTSR